MTVYFIRECREGGCIKIGYTQESVWGRMLELQTGNSARLEAIGIIPDASIVDEFALHNRFSEFRVLGEWFRPAAELLDFIQQETEEPEIPLPRDGGMALDKDFCLLVVESALLRYKEGGSTFSVIRLEKEGGAGIFLPGVDYVDGKLILCSQNTAAPEVKAVST